MQLPWPQLGLGHPAPQHLSSAPRLTFVESLVAWYFARRGGQAHPLGKTEVVHDLGGPPARATTGTHLARAGEDREGLEELCHQRLEEMPARASLEASWRGEEVMYATSTLSAASEP